MIDSHGYRASIGIILLKGSKVFWGKRLGNVSWQFPQGGIQREEKYRDALFRELWEELGLHENDVQVIGSTANWQTYKLPTRLVRYHAKPVCVGQKQKWFLLRLLSPDDKINLFASNNPEFDEWTWVNYWYPINAVVRFKRDVYRNVLQEFAPIVFENHQLSAEDENKRLRNPKQRLRSALRPRRRDQREEDLNIPTYATQTSEEKTQATHFYFEVDPVEKEKE